MKLIIFAVISVVFFVVALSMTIREMAGFIRDIRDMKQ